MVWPFSKTTAPSPASQQIHQQSHTPLGLSDGRVSNDISNTLNQLLNEDGLPHVQTLSTESVRKINDLVSEFVHKQPKNVFIIDGEKYSDESIICTNDRNGNKTCLKLNFNSIQLFKHMQSLEYFCSLPDDIDATYFECRKIT